MRAKYAAMGAPDVVLYLLGLVLVAVVGLFREVDLWFFAGVLGGAAAWELTKLRLRRNATRFATGSGT